MRVWLDARSFRGLNARMSSQGATLAQFFRQAETVTVVTGAGVSTASGIPAYRDDNGDWKHSTPVQFADFINNTHARQRYWARSFTGWQFFSAAMPNKAHHALAELENYGFLDKLITQNVDGLHERAGSRAVIDLHGRLDTVVCMRCRNKMQRAEWQRQLSDANPSWHSTVDSLKPDGDVQLEQSDFSSFLVPDCEICGGVLKPDVVFFGESVPRDRVQAATASIAQSRALLIIGSSMTVFSGYRFARLAVEKSKPVAILNQGKTRADDIAQLKLEGECGRVLQQALVSLNPARLRAGLAT